MTASKSLPTCTPTQSTSFSLPADAQTVLHERRDHEERIVAMLKDESAVRIIERSSGLLTQDVFESPWRMSSICVPLASLRGLFSNATSEEVLSDTALFFLISDRHLCEFMDFLDANGVPFRHEITLGTPHAPSPVDDP